MPIFYSQYLKNDRKALPACEVSRQIDKGKPNSPSKLSNKLSSMKGSRRSPPQRSQEEPLTPPSSPPSPSRLVWHSNKGKGVSLKTKLFSAFHKDSSKKKTVHFAAIEVQPYNWDYSCDEDVFLKKEQIMEMNKDRFKDAKKLRKERNITAPSDVDITKRACEIERLLKEAYDPKLDKDDEVSICGIEHFVYPALQQEMIRRKNRPSRRYLIFRGNVGRILMGGDSLG